MGLKLLLLCSALIACTNAAILIQAEKAFTLSGELFNFTCLSNTTNFTKLVVLVNNKTATDRLTIITVTENKQYTFLYNDVMPADNGTTFVCHNVSAGTVATESALLTMEVAYTNFEQTNASDALLWMEFSDSSNFTINCTVEANPLNITITSTNTTENSDNVEFTEYNVTSAGFTFTTAQVNNTGNYTCTATNGLVTNSITYRVFVGGPPDNVTFDSVVVKYSEPLIIIQFNVTDFSDAPAQGVRVEITDLGSGVVNFSEPNENDSMLFSYQLGHFLNETVPKKYEVHLIAFNSLGNGSLLSEVLFFAGTNFDVAITTTDTNISEHSSFNITCNSSAEMVNISLTINGIDSAEVLNVTEIDNTTSSKIYMLSSAMAANNGNVFMCMAVNENANKTSTEVTLNVLYAPKFQNFNNRTHWLEFAVNSSFNLSCSLNSTGNPPISGGIRYTNVTGDISNVNTTMDNTSLVYEVTEATVTNKVNLTCIANSSYATTTLTYLTFVGGPPNNVTVTPKVTVEGGIVFLDLQVMDESDAPARSYFLNIPDIYNDTVVTNLPNATQTFSRLLNKSAELFGNDKHYLVITANNTLGSAVVYNQTLNIPVDSSSVQSATSTMSPSPTSGPTKAPSTSSNAGAIAAGIIVPVVVLILVAFAVGTAYYFYKNRKSNRDFKLLSSMGGEAEDANAHSGYGTHTTT